MRQCYTESVRRFALAVVVALLTFSFSGLPALVTAEPCTSLGQAAEDGSCPPTCVACRCCAQAAEPALVLVAITPHSPVIDIATLSPGVPRVTSREILHVPKTA